MEDKDKLIIKGFNNGYWIAKYQPDLLAGIEKNVNSPNEYVQGLLFGKKEHEAERNIIKLNTAKQSRIQTKNLDKGK
jgi:hypothetical protein